MTKEEVFESVKYCTKVEEIKNNHKNDKDIYFVYIHINKINGKVYIGQTSQFPISRRWGAHGRKYLRKDKEGNFSQPSIARAILKYGWENFEHYVLEANLTMEEAAKKERYYIKKYNSRNKENGYNIAYGNESPKRRKETKEKLSIFMKGKKLSEETKKKISASLKGRPGRPGSFKYAQAANKGRKRTDKEKENVSKGARASDKTNVTHVICVETEEWFETMIDASNAKGNGGTTGARLIGRSCDDHHYSYNGLHWIRESEIDKENWDKQKWKILHWINNINKPVECIETKQIYKNVTIANEGKWIGENNIRDCCKGKIEKAGNLHWRYISIEEFLERGYYNDLQTIKSES